MFKSSTLLFLIIISSFHQLIAQSSTEWPCYGRDAGGSRYSPLTEINEQTVSRLDTAWIFHTGELETYKGTDALSKAAFEATPIMIGGRLYFSTASDRVFALDAATGKPYWMYDPKVNLKTNFSEVTSRGVSAWPGGGNGPVNPIPKTIFIATIDGRLIALNATTGIPVSTFGNRGTVDLKVGYGTNLSVTSPPAVIGNLIIVGSSLGDNTRHDETKGAVRAYDVNSGKLMWSWDPVPRDSTDKAWKTWKGAKAHSAGAANVWSQISVDAARNLIFVPATSPSPDYYGGERLGQNLYGNSLVALNALTGKVSWYFQVVHHDLWDYDIAAQPMLVDIERNNKKIPAVVIGTKMGHVFILDRITGESLFPVEERVMPASSVPGEESWLTQPVPILPAPLGMQRISASDAWGITRDDSLVAATRIKRYVNRGIFTPPSLQGTIITPGNVGGIHWGGMCYDARRGFIITNINRLAALITLVPRDSMATLKNTHEELLRIETGSQTGTPYVVKRDYLFAIKNNQFALQTKPPWGTLLSIDIKNGRKEWEVPLGFMMDPVKYPEAVKWGSLNLGGAIVTAGNLVFVAASLDGHLRAFSTATGQMLWKYLLPAGGQATPMTYSVKGKQYLVIAAGGHGKINTKQGDNLVAFALNGAR